MIYYVSDCNRRLKMNEQKFIDYSEFEYYARCREVAEYIADHINEKPVVLIAGPSGSGKTTTAIVIEHFLLDWGFKAHSISLDNYFHDLTEEQREMAKIGKYDLESPARIDHEFLNSQLCDILLCKRVHMPKYNFAISKREFSGWIFQRERNEVIIFEGIHALNPNVITINPDSVTNVYVSIRSSFSNGETTIYSPTIRLSRRMLRDVVQRDLSPENVIHMYDKVNEGEDKYIKPFRERCTHSIDTLIPYGINLYKTLLYDRLQKHKGHEEIDKILDLLKDAQGINPDLIPNNSLMREFIGGSVLKY